MTGYIENNLTTSSPKGWYLEYCYDTIYHTKQISYVHIADNELEFLNDEGVIYYRCIIPTCIYSRIEGTFNYFKLTKEEVDIHILLEYI